MSQEKDWIIRYSYAEMLKEIVMDFMDILNRYEDFSKTKKAEPSGMVIIDWMFDKVQKNIALASNIGKGEYFQAAEELIEEARSQFNLSIHSIDDVIQKLREAITKITTEGARSSEKLF
ncbi:MAG: hypothetical protein ACTSRW_07585 [Candidatus Helarchaeota archaeon]